MTNTTVSHTAQAEIYSKGIGHYRGWIVEMDQTYPNWWMAGTSLLSGVEFSSEALGDVLWEIDRRENS